MKHLLLALGIALLSSSCTSTYYTHRFLPAPIEAPSAIEGDPSSQARVLLTVVGIRRADKQSGRPVQVEVRMQVENLGSTPARLEVEGLALRDSDLTAFDTAVVVPAVPEPIANGESAVYEIAFPLPAGVAFSDLELRGLHVSWVISFGERRVTTGVSFERLQPMNTGAYGSMQFHYGRYGPRYPHRPRPTPY